MRNTLLIAIATLTLVLSGCASDSGALSRETRKAQYNRYAGEPVPKVRMINLHSWTNIDRDQIVLWSNARDAYLVDLFSPCLGLDRGVVNAIGVSNFGNTIYARSDAIIVGGERCLIDTIRPIDTKALNEERRAARSGGTLQPREEASLAQD